MLPPRRAARSPSAAGRAAVSAASSRLRLGRGASTTPPARGRASPPAVAAGAVAGGEGKQLDEVRACSDDDLPVAIAQLQTALAGDQSLHRLLAAAHARAGNLELAEPHARAALQREADDAEMLFVIGVAAEKRDEVLEAIDNFEAALEIEPDFWRPLFHLGKASMSVGMISDAHEYLQQVLELNPGHAPTLALMAKFDGVDVLELQQELNEVLRKPPQASTTDNLSDFM